MYTPSDRCVFAALALVGLVIFLLGAACGALVAWVL